ncbi:MAG TPA: sugar phosphate isomerase/epimerase family protein [Tepidisphaeraceae bacterium]|nr:sugar phosphate isomerase/epimerase family protein [Tepidisphaeraceae bacterium]
MPTPAAPRLAAFPKAWMDELTLTGSMSLRQWIETASKLGVDGVELYFGFLDLKDAATWPATRRMIEDHGLTMPMLCVSPDFTHPDPAFRQQQVDQQKRMIDMTHTLGGRYCRVLSGQRRPEISREQGLRYAADSITACLPHAQDRNVILILENHYKDNYWQYPEFAQKTDVFCDLVAAVDHANFGVNYDPSNTILAGEDPLDLLARVKDRVVTMHASDRYLASGTIDDLRKEEDSVGYAQRLRHGEIGRGMNDYDAIFSTLQSAGFGVHPANPPAWISIEDGVDGLEQLQHSVEFLRAKMEKYWG